MTVSGSRDVNGFRACCTTSRTAPARSSSTATCDESSAPTGCLAGFARVTPGAGPRIYRDVSYPAYDQVVELDGRLFHDSALDRDADLDRDLDAAVDRLGTVRLGWGQVFGRPCRTAARVALLLQYRGWPGSPTPCGPECDLSGTSC